MYLRKYSLKSHRESDQILFTYGDQAEYPLQENINDHLCKDYRRVAQSLMYSARQEYAAANQETVDTSQKPPQNDQCTTDASTMLDVPSECQDFSTGSEVPAQQAGYLSLGLEPIGWVNEEAYNLISIKKKRLPMFDYEPIFHMPASMLEKPIRDNGIQITELFRAIRKRRGLPEIPQEEPEADKSDIEATSSNSQASDQSRNSLLREKPHSRNQDQQPVIPSK